MPEVPNNEGGVDARRYCIDWFRDRGHHVKVEFNMVSGTWRREMIVWHSLDAQQHWNGPGPTAPYVTVNLPSRSEITIGRLSIHPYLEIALGLITGRTPVGLETCRCCGAPVTTHRWDYVLCKLCETGCASCSDRMPRCRSCGWATVDGEQLHAAGCQDKIKKTVKLGRVADV